MWLLISSSITSSTKQHGSQLEEEEGAIKALLRLYQCAIKEEFALLALCHVFSRQTQTKSDIF
jgi:hypothetical protein